MREIKPQLPKVTQKNLIDTMDEKPIGIYSLARIYNYMIAKGFKMSKASVRNHIDKIVQIGCIRKATKCGLVAFEFYKDTTYNWQQHDDERARVTAINRANMLKHRGKAERESKTPWGAGNLKGIPGTKVTMMGV